MIKLVYLMMIKDLQKLLSGLFNGGKWSVLQ